MPIPSVTVVADATSGAHDAVVLVVRDVATVPYAEVAAAAAIDARFSSKVSIVAAAGVAGGRIIVSCTGPLARDFDDPRSISDAAKAGVRAAIDAGARAPVLHLAADVSSVGGEFARAPLLALAGALDASYATIQTREHMGDAAAEPLTDIGVFFEGVPAEEVAKTVEAATAVEAGRRLARDVCSGDPERMAPQQCVDEIAASLAGKPRITIEVLDDVAELTADYPLLSAVARASIPVPEHRPRVMIVTYTPPTVTQQVMLVGKGIVYDTGGADIKAGGIMAGMKRDKGGAAAIAGLMRTVAEVQPEGTKYRAFLGFVRNSIGSRAYVADEVIRGHSGRRVLVVNTDAEGRMVMADLLSRARTEAAAEVAAGHAAAADFSLFTAATLTGHAVVAMGVYPIALDNGPAAARGEHGTARAIQAAAHVVGDPFEVSTIRREDYDMVRSRHPSYDVLQCNTLPSSRTPRGHQFPAAFLIRASGLDEHGRDADVPLAYTHLDIAAAASRGDVASGYETGSPVLGLAAHFLGL